MVSVEEALRLVLLEKANYGVEDVPLSRAVNRILAEDVLADRDFPPYDRVAMDGIAINSASFAKGQRVFRIEGLQAAGDLPGVLSQPLNCIEVMTGAVLPQGADTVIPYEQVSVQEGSASIEGDALRLGQHIHRRATDSQKGAVLIPKGVRIRGAHTGILASVGKSCVPVLRLPKVAVCSTGDELVPVDSTPASHQIRASNAMMLSASLEDEGIEAPVFHYPDDREKLREGLRTLIEQYDVLLFSGAVSRGKLDFLPDVLDEFGLKTAFHRIAQRPGKPLLFGSFDQGTKVFGFPGNPVSTFVCYHYYFRAWLYASLGIPFAKKKVRLGAPVSFAPSLSYHLLVSVECKDGYMDAYPANGSGSGDLTCMVRADGFVTLPADREGFSAGEVFDLISF